MSYVVQVPAEHQRPLHDRLDQKTVGVLIFYPIPLSQHPAFEDFPRAPGDLPGAQAAATRNIGLPLYPGLHDRQIAYVVRTVADFFRRVKRA